MIAVVPAGGVRQGGRRIVVQAEIGAALRCAEAFVYDDLAHGLRKRVLGVMSRILFRHCSLGAATWLSSNPFHVTLPKRRRDGVKE
jgi:hypothetical protein